MKHLFPPFYSIVVSSRISVDTRTGLYGELPTAKTSTAMMSLYRPCTGSDLSNSTHFSVILFHFRMKSVTWQSQSGEYLIAFHYYKTITIISDLCNMLKSMHVKECVSDILYIGTRNMQWCSPLYRSATMTTLHCTVLLSGHSSLHCLYIYTWSDSHM